MVSERIYKSERTLIALIMLDSAKGVRVNPYMLTVEKFRDLLLHIISGHPGGTVTKDWIDKLTSETSFDMPWTDIEILLEERNKYGFYDDKEIEQIFVENMKIITDENERKQLLLTLQEAISCAERGERNEAIRLARGLQLNSTAKALNFWTIFTEYLDTDWGFRTGIPEFDDDGGLSKGNLMALIADTGAQKTMFSLWLMIKILAHNPDFVGVYFEKEMHEIEIAKRIISFMTGMDNRDLSKYHLLDAGSKDATYRKLTDMITKQLDNDSIYVDAIKRLKIIPGREFRNAEDMYDIIHKYKADIWCLDYMTMLEPRSGSLDEESTRSQVKILKEITTNLNTFGIVLSQIKHSNGLAQRYNKIPELDDMEWGKPLKQLSSWIYSIFYPYMYYKNDSIKRFFYLVPKKGRTGPLQEMMFYSKPETCEYIDPKKENVKEGNAFGQMVEWLADYRADRRKQKYGNSTRSVSNGQPMPAKVPEKESMAQTELVLSVDSTGGS